MGKERGTVPITRQPSQRNPSLLTAGATLPCRIHCHITLPQKMMQSQKLLGLSIYLPWLQAQMPLDTVSDETNKAINLRHQKRRLPPENCIFLYTNSPVLALSRAEEPADAWTFNPCEHETPTRRQGTGNCCLRLPRASATFLESSLLKFVTPRPTIRRLPFAPCDTSSPRANHQRKEVYFYLKTRENTS